MTTKRDELQTYKELKLKRDFKSQARRKGIEAGGKRRVLGDGSLSAPYLTVDAARYRHTWLEMARMLLLEAKKMDLGLDIDLLLPRLHRRIEALAYAKLAAECRGESAQKSQPKGFRRELTKTEKERFQETEGHAYQAECSREGKDAARIPGDHSSRLALDHVLGQVAQRLVNNPARYAAIWAELVGLDAASQTEFIGVDEATETGYFRCLNSVLSMNLQRKIDLPKKLGAALGKRIRRLKTRF